MFYPVFQATRPQGQRHGPSSGVHVTGKYDVYSSHLFFPKNPLGLDLSNLHAVRFGFLSLFVLKRAGLAMKTPSVTKGKAKDDPDLKPFSKGRS